MVDQKMKKCSTNTCGTSDNAT